MPTVTVPLISPEEQQKQLAEGKINVILPNGQVITPTKEALVQEAYRRSESQGAAQAAASYGSPSPPAQYPNVEAKPLNSMTAQQAEKEGYNYSGAAGYVRYPATEANIKIAVADMVRQREQYSAEQNRVQTSPRDPNEIYYIDGQEVSRTEYLNRLAISQSELHAEEGRLRNLDQANRATNQTATTTAIPSSSIHSGLENITQSEMIPSTPRYSEDSMEKVRAMENKKIYDTASPLQKLGLHAATLFSSEGWRYIGSTVNPDETMKDVVLKRMALAEEEGGGLNAMVRHAISNPVTFTLSLSPIGRGVSAGAKAVGLVFGAQAAKGIDVGLNLGLAGTAFAKTVEKYNAGEKSQAIGETMIIGGVAMKAGADLLFSKIQLTRGFSSSDVVAKTQDTTLSHGKAVYQTDTVGKSVRSTAEFDTLTKRIPTSMTSYGKVISASVEQGKMTVNERSLLDRALNRPGKTREIQYKGEATGTTPSKKAIMTEEGFKIPKGARAGRFAIETSEGQTTKGAYLQKQVMRKGNVRVSNSVFQTGRLKYGKSVDVVRDINPPKNDDPYTFFKGSGQKASVKSAPAGPSMAKTIHDEITSPAAKPSSPAILSPSSELDAVMHSPARIEPKKKAALQGETVVSLTPQNKYMPNFAKEKQKNKGKTDNPEKFFRVASKQGQQQRIVNEKAQEQVVSDRMLRMPSELGQSRVPRQKRAETPMYVPEQYVRNFEPQKPMQRQKPAQMQRQKQTQALRLRNPARFGTGMRPNEQMQRYLFRPRSSGHNPEMTGRTPRGGRRKKYWEVINPVGDLAEVANFQFRALRRRR